MEADPPAGVTRLQNGPRKVSGRAAPGAAGPDPGVSAVSALCTAGTAAASVFVTLLARIAEAAAAWTAAVEAVTVTGQGETLRELTMASMFIEPVASAVA